MLQVLLRPGEEGQHCKRGLRLTPKLRRAERGRNCATEEKHYGYGAREIRRGLTTIAHFGVVLGDISIQDCGYSFHRQNLDKSRDQEALRSMRTRQKYLGSINATFIPTIMHYKYNEKFPPINPSFVFFPLQFKRPCQVITNYNRPQVKSSIPTNASKQA